MLILWAIPRTFELRPRHSGTQAAQVASMAQWRRQTLLSFAASARTVLRLRRAGDPEPSVVPSRPQPIARGIEAPLFSDTTERQRLLQESERRRRAAEGLAEVGRLISQSLDVTEVADRITESVRNLIGVTNSALFEARPDTDEPYRCPSRAITGRPAASPSCIRSGSGPPGWPRRSGSRSSPRTSSRIRGYRSPRSSGREWSARSSGR